MANLRQSETLSHLSQNHPLVGEACHKVWSGYEWTKSMSPTVLASLLRMTEDGLIKLGTPLLTQIQPQLQHVDLLALQQITAIEKTWETSSQRVKDSSLSMAHTLLSKADECVDKYLVVTPAAPTESCLGDVSSTVTGHSYALVAKTGRHLGERVGQMQTAASDTMARVLESLGLLQVLLSARHVCQDLSQEFWTRLSDLEQQYSSDNAQADPGSVDGGGDNTTTSSAAQIKARLQRIASHYVAVTNRVLEALSGMVYQRLDEPKRQRLREMRASLRQLYQRLSQLPDQDDDKQQEEENRSVDEAVELVKSAATYIDTGVDYRGGLEQGDEHVEATVDSSNSETENRSVDEAVELVKSAATYIDTGVDYRGGLEQGDEHVEATVDSSNSTEEFEVSLDQLPNEASDE